MTEKRTPPHVRARQDILELIGRLTAKGIDRLPGERQLSADLGVSLNTIKKAIRQLVSEDRLATAPRDGHFIRAKRETTEIGIIIGEGQTSSFIRNPDVLSCILSTLHRHGCNGRLLQVREPDDAARIFEQYRIDGCVWFMPNPSLLNSIAAVSRRCPVPIVVPLADPAPPELDLPSGLFTNDFVAIGRARAEFLLARGHRRIVYCSDDVSASFTGFSAALADRGVPLDRSLLIMDPAETPLRLPAMLLAGGATAIISDGGIERLEPLFSILEGHPWNGQGDLLIDYIGAGHDELCRRHPLVRIAAINHFQNQEIGLRATEALIAAIHQRGPIQGFRCASRILPMAMDHLR